MSSLIQMQPSSHISTCGCSFPFTDPSVTASLLSLLTWSSRCSVDVLTCSRLRALKLEPLPLRTACTWRLRPSMSPCCSSDTYPPSSPQRSFVGTPWCPCPHLAVRPWVGHLGARCLPWQPVPCILLLQPAPVPDGPGLNRLGEAHTMLQTLGTASFKPSPASRHSSEKGFVVLLVLL